MMESLSAGPRSELVAAGLFLSALLLLAACHDPDSQQAWTGPDAGVAVTVQLGEAVVPGLFPGSRDSAAVLTDSRFHFPEGAGAVLILRAGMMWSVEDDPRFSRPGMAVAVYRADESIVPGLFRGPRALAEYLNEELAVERGVPAWPPSTSLLLPESHSRVQAIEPGMSVRLTASY